MGSGRPSRRAACFQMRKKLAATVPPAFPRTVCGDSMSKNAKLSTALHVLFYLNQNRDRVWTSDTIAGSINTNPVVIRRLLGALKKAGLVKVVSGKHGGYQLARPADRITTFDVFRAVQDRPLFDLNPNEPDGDCPVGRHVGPCLQGFYDQLEGALEREMKAKTLQQLMSEISV